MTAVAAILLALAVAATATSGLALLAVRDGRDRIHFAGPATALAPFLVASALAAGGAGGAIVAKGAALAVLLAATSTFVSHALLGAAGPRGPREGR
ncbi:MAG TPA: hypothetical protein VF841_13970 [Anaeromyxobacter sp.]